MDTPATSQADLLLEEMALAGRRAEPPGAWKPSRGAKPPLIRYTHDAMVDLVIENPIISQNEIAALFGYSPAWVSTIFTSDAFKARLAARRAEIVDPVLQMTLRERIEALTQQSLRILQEKLARPADQVPDNLALKALELGTKAMGLGPAQVVVATEDRLANLANRLIALQGRARAEAIDVESRSV